MPLRIRPNAIEQDEGDFIFPGVISLVGTTEFSFDADGVTGSSLITARDTSSGFRTPITIFGSVIQLTPNDGDPAIRVQQGGGAGKIILNPISSDFDLEYLADDGTKMLFGDAGLARIGFGTNVPTGTWHVAGSLGSWHIDDDGSALFGNRAGINYFGGLDPAGTLWLAAGGDFTYPGVFIDQNLRVGIGTSNPISPYSLSVINTDTSGFHANVDRYTGFLVGQTGSAETLAFDAIDYNAFGGFYLGLMSVNARYNPNTDTWTRSDANYGALNLDMQINQGSRIPEYIFKTWETGTSAWLPALHVRPDQTMVSDQYDWWNGFTNLAVRSQQDYSSVGGYEAYTSLRVMGSGSSPPMIALQAARTGVIDFNSLNSNVDFNPQSGTWSLVNEDFHGTILQAQHRLAFSRLSLWHLDTAGSFHQYWQSNLPSGTTGQKTFEFNPQGGDIDFTVRDDASNPAIHMQASDGFVGFNTDTPGRRIHILEDNELYLRLNTTGTSTADQIEYLRGSSYTWLGPTAGNEFHLWSQENMPLVIGLNNTEIGRWHPEKYWELKIQSGALSTGTQPSSSMRFQVHNQGWLMTQRSGFEMVGVPHGWAWVWTNDPNQAIAASGTYTNIPWLGSGGNLLSPLKACSVDALSGTGTSLDFNRYGEYTIHATISCQLVSGAGPVTVHAYLDEGGSKVFGSDMYVTVSDLYMISTGATTVSKQMLVGEKLILKASKILGSGTVNLAALGTGAKIFVTQSDFV